MIPRYDSANLKKISVNTPEYNPNLDANVGWKIHFDPIDESDETIQKIINILDNKYAFKYDRKGKGKNFTLYAQSMQIRDLAIVDIENNPEFSSLIKESYGDLKNLPIDDDSLQEGNRVLSRRTTGRFSTQYVPVYEDPAFPGELIPNWNRDRSGKNILFERGWSGANDKQKRLMRYTKFDWFLPEQDSPYYSRWNQKPFRLSRAEKIEDIVALKENFPEIYELLNPTGYTSPPEVTGYYPLTEAEEIINKKQQQVLKPVEKIIISPQEQSQINNETKIVGRKVNLTSSAKPIETELVSEKPPVSGRYWNC